MNTEHETVLLKRLKAALDADLGRLDSRTLARLRAARRQALDVPARPRPALTRIAYAGLAAAVLAVAGVGLWPPAQPPAVMTSGLDDSELLQGRDQLELYRDLEFYRWLATVERRG